MDIERIKKSPRFIGEINSGVLSMLPNSKPGDITYTKDTHKVLVYENDEMKWVPYKEKQIDTGLTLMELNRSAIAQMPCKEATAFKKESYSLLDEFSSKMGEFLMLYGKEIDYFTIFKLGCYSCEGETDYENFPDAFLDCLLNVGKVYSIDYADKTENAIEVWVKTPKGKTTVLYLFSYDDGIVRVKN